MADSKEVQPGGESQPDVAEGHPGVNPVVMRYPVTQPAGHVQHQLILVTGVDEDGAIRGVPLGYEHEAARFPVGALV